MLLLRSLMHHNSMFIKASQSHQLALFETS